MDFRLVRPNCLGSKMCFFRILPLVLLLFLGEHSFGQEETEVEQERSSAARPKTVLAHYMPWFASKPISGAWGWHWKMKNCDPEQQTGDRREIASHYYPLIGPYDSNDPDVLECQVLLMKLTGINGVVIDWYGIEDHWDYAINHRNSLHLVEYVKKAGLKFAVCYEDQTVRHLVDAKIVKPEEQVQHGKKVVKWLAENWFSDEAYLKLDGKPLLLVFGPQYFKEDELKQICESLHQPPILFALPHLSAAAKADGAFGWPPVDSGKSVSPESWLKYCRDLESRGDADESTIPIVFPGFKDFYQQGEDRPSFGSIEHRDGKTLLESLEFAMNSKSNLVQIATWNDYGEGTMIEPTREFGYQFLESIQSELLKRRTERRTEFSSSAQDLRLPIALYELRKDDENRTPDRAAKVDEFSDLLFAGKCDAARRLLKSLHENR
jgi:hypothetical protein